MLHRNTINSNNNRMITDAIFVILKQVEIEKDNSLWNENELEIVKKEFIELENCMKTGDLIQRKYFMLESTYIITDSIKPLCNTLLGEKILHFQELIRKINL